MPLNQDQYSIEELIEMARDNPEMAVIQVTKRRYGFMIEDIMCEYAYVYFNGAMLETACCEGEDYSRIKDAVDALGIGTLPNTNYLKAAKQVLGII